MNTFLFSGIFYTAPSVTIVGLVCHTLYGYDFEWKANKTPKMKCPKMNYRPIYKAHLQYTAGQIRQIKLATAT